MHNFCWSSKADEVWSFPLSLPLLEFSTVAPYSNPWGLVCLCVIEDKIFEPRVFVDGTCGEKRGGYFVYVLYFVWFNTYAWDWIWIKKSMCICIYYEILYMNFSNTWCIYAARVDRDQPVPHGQRRLHIYTYNPRESKRPGISNISHSFFMFSRCSNGMRGWQKS